MTRLFLPGDYCELCWAHGKRASQHVVALTSVRTLRFLSRDFERMLLDSPAVQEMIWSEALIHADIQDEWIINLGRKSAIRSEEHTSELQSLMRISYAVFCLKKKRQT